MSTEKSLLPLSTALLIVGCAGQGSEPEAARAEEPLSLREALSGGQAVVRARYRFEEVDDDGAATEAHASTLRTTVGYETERFESVRGRLAFENIAAAVGNDLYNSTVNGRVENAVVADPEGTELEEAWLAWDGVEDLEVKLGRQEITLGNQRFVGNVGWRQNHQTFDAVRADWIAPSDTRVFAAYVHNVNRIFGDDSAVGDARSDTVLLQADHTFMPELAVRAFGFLLDSDNLPASSTATYGARAAGTIEAGEDLDALYALELAVQSDRGDNPNDVDQEYLLAELGARVSKVTARVGLEQLGGSGDPGDAFQTPLATLHKFNGWADRFLVTPQDGLVDLYVAVNGKVEDVAWQVAWHAFSTDEGSDDYGSELDLVVQRPLNDWIVVGLKAAFYDADDYGGAATGPFLNDATKAWAWIALAP